VRSVNPGATTLGSPIRRHWVPGSTAVTWPPLWFGSIQAGPDFSRHYDQVLAEGFGRD
jgi:hypothetical protein